jgi:hypothetical protein
LVIDFSYAWESIDVIVEFAWLIENSCSLRYLDFHYTGNSDDISQFKSIVSKNGSITKSSMPWCQFAVRNALNLGKCKDLCLVLLALKQFLAKDLTTLLGKALLQTYADVTTWAIKD